MTTNEADEIRTAVREHYARAALEAGAGCCGDPATAASGDPATAICGDPVSTSDAFGRSLYQVGDREVLPEAALVASLGCGSSSPARIARIFLRLISSHTRAGRRTGAPRLPRVGDPACPG